ncbi:unnamed protein product [Rotaria socialis]|uniref:Uncharacterized protein n=3 Tax=Rotaria socialis TaxID=392032 RepID=A0A818MVL3_9BILA|nr:unnamed protein product [Rotaria socialis]
MKTTVDTVVFYLIIFQTIQRYECLHCYACNGKDECGISFSSNSSTIKRVESKGDDFLDVCTISVNSEGITTRGLILSPVCHSSANQFCCKEDWCNSLPAPPLPALTSRTCRIDRCLGTNNACDSISNIATLSSATESCTGALAESEQTVMMTYKKKCTPGQYAATQDGSFTLAPYFCCNSPECNQQRVPPKLAIQCYTCDSRVTGLTGCSTFDLSSPHVYESGSSDSDEACATIIGLTGKDSFTNVTYPTFFIRTFIQHCKNQSLGNISYGGATFQGRINCCWKNHCNIERACHEFMTMRNIDRGKPVTARSEPGATTRMPEASKRLRGIAETMYQIVKIIPRVPKTLPDVADSMAGVLRGTPQVPEHIP